MSFFRENDWRDDLSEQLEALRGEIASLRRDASRKSSRAVASTRHTGEDVFETIRDYFNPPKSFYQRGSRLASDNPGTTAAAALVGVALVGLAATFFLSQSSRTEQRDYPGTPTPPPSDN
ncbi:hypothetical protein B7H23_06500 [Notoacmeibacter marinus]|uniref:DUF3618 domain-containing protein n=1 Tax=Notoacmeibacter marinus TaxID=1876515 RepID=A0A231V323_9HYPH|nr:hypothetical protein [Notoacmeibacter marinus]OXT02537.1 hypothetical protein B7H23_06500 [Notoacmeibacter marinus]